MKTFSIVIVDGYNTENFFIKGNDEHTALKEQFDKGNYFGCPNIKATEDYDNNLLTFLQWTEDNNIEAAEEEDTEYFIMMTEVK